MYVSSFRNETLCVCILRVSGNKDSKPMCNQLFVARTLHVRLEAACISMSKKTAFSISLVY